jgi:histidyl-tRNA synthetase
MDKSLGDQVKEAVRRGIPYFIAYGQTELNNGMVKIKTLAESSEKEVSAAEVVNELRNTSIG